MQKQIETRYRNEVTGSSGIERLYRLMREYQIWFAAVGYAAVGYIMANSRVFDGVSPFGVAFCASLGGASAIPAALGATVGYIFAAEANMKYIAAVMLVATVKWLFGSNRMGILGKDLVMKHTAASSVFTAFFALLVSGAAVIFSSTYMMYDLIMNLSEIFMACGATYFFTRATALLKAGWSGASKADISCIVISFAIIVMGFADIKIAQLSVGKMLSALVILIAARYGGEAASSVAGIIAGAGMSLAGADMSYVIAAYAFGGLVAGVFGGIGRIAAAASFIVTNAVVAFLTQDSVNIYNSLFEVFVASVIFMAIPQSWMSKLRPLRTSSADGGYARSILRDRLLDISLALSGIGTTTRRVSEGLDRLDGETQQDVDISARAAEKVCRRCSMKSTCWQFSRIETIRAMESALMMLKRGGSISKSRIPRYFAENCRKLDELVTELNAQFQSFASREGTQRKVSQVRSVITDQFDGLSMMIDELSDEICAVRTFDESKARRVKDYFEREGVEASRVQTYTDEYERMCVSLVIPNHHIAKLHRTKSALDLCGLLEAEFDQPEITARKRQAAVVFTEKATFAVELGAYQVAGDGNRICGDAYEYIGNKSGKTHLILSDGMGSGGNAAVDSTMATSLLSQLLGVGISHEAALKMVNSALMVKSSDESLATLDVVTIDLYTGRADFYKAGAAPTYLIKNGRAGYIELASLPVGILRAVAFERSVTALRENDIVVMVSDGVTATGVDWVKGELENLKSLSVQRICEKLAAAAKSRRTDNHEDDITVIAAAIRRA